MMLNYHSSILLTIYAATSYFLISTSTPFLTISLTFFSNSFVVDSSIYFSLQLSQICDGTSLKTIVELFFSKVTVVVPSFVSPCLQMMHLIFLSFFYSILNIFFKSISFKHSLDSMFSVYKYNLFFSILTVVLYLKFYSSFKLTNSSLVILGINS